MTIRTKEQLMSAFADNTSGNIGADDGRDLIDTLFAEHRFIKFTTQDEEDDVIEIAFQLVDYDRDPVAENWELMMELFTNNGSMAQASEYTVSSVETGTRIFQLGGPRMAVVSDNDGLVEVQITDQRASKSVENLYVYATIVYVNNAYESRGQQQRVVITFDGS